jgi:MarR family transcriptional regulator, organic hydroperoxide resistance regulator
VFGADGDVAGADGRHRCDEELRYLILAVQREGSRLLAADLQPLRLTPSQAEVLRVLHDYQPLTLSALGRLLVCENHCEPQPPGRPAGIAGVVQRTTDPDNRRFVTLTLTPQGRRIEREILAVEDRLQLLRNVANAFPAGQALTSHRDGGRTLDGVPAERDAQCADR